jgi:mevalonate pyrophosphate decarboxylase
MRKDVSDAEFENMKEQDEKERQEKVAEVLEEIKSLPTIDTARNQEIKDIITSKWKSVSKETKEEVKVIMSEYSIEKIGDIETNSTEGMEAILQKIQ